MHEKLYRVETGKNEEDKSWLVLISENDTNDKQLAMLFQSGKCLGTKTFVPRVKGDFTEIVKALVNYDEELANYKFWTQVYNDKLIKKLTENYITYENGSTNEEPDSEKLTETLIAFKQELKMHSEFYDNNIEFIKTLSKEPRKTEAWYQRDLITFFDVRLINAWDALLDIQTNVYEYHKPMTIADFKKLNEKMQLVAESANALTKALEEKNKPAINNNFESPGYTYGLG